MPPFVLVYDFSSQMDVVSSIIWSLAHMASFVGLAFCGALRACGVVFLVWCG
ncbi:hypothetical protein ACIGBN_14545 [Marinomonas sp. NPDC078689]|uniref:hypothetical protein n=1 Tax=unclassified Marinomonas TaxID=196814 RepID=UPI0037CA288A